LKKTKLVEINFVVNLAKRLLVATGFSNNSATITLCSIRTLKDLAGKPKKEGSKENHPVFLLILYAKRFFW